MLPLFLKQRQGLGSAKKETLLNRFGPRAVKHLHYGGACEGSRKSAGVTRWIS